jgi:electron transfer flavoprotein beta subunit
MKILVAVKQVPVRDSALRPDAGGSGLEESDLSWEMNEPDAYALEEALQLKEKLGGEVVAISAGPARVQQTLREALAKGSDRAIHIDFQDAATPDPLEVAKLLADAGRGEGADLILTGLQSDDLGYGQTGVLMAELLGYAHATIVMEIEPQGASVRVKRELEDGWFQNVTLPLPAVLTIQSGIRKLRYATLMGIKKAKTKELKVVKVSAPARANANSDHLYMPSRGKQSQILTGAPQQVAKELVDKLRFEARVL